MKLQAFAHKRDNVDAKKKTRCGHLAKFSFFTCKLLVLAKWTTPVNEEVRGCQKNLRPHQNAKSSGRAMLDNQKPGGEKAIITSGRLTTTKDSSGTETVL